jgi:hypothetical protein
VLAHFLGRLDPCLRVTRVLPRFVGDLLRPAIGLVGGRAGSGDGLVCESSGLRLCLCRVLEELFGPLSRRLGIALSVLDLVVDLFPNLLSMLYGICFSSLAFLLHVLVGGLLGHGDAPLDLSTRFALDLAHAGASPLAHLSRVVGESLGLPRGLDGLVLGLSSTLRGVLRTSYADFD